MVQATHILLSVSDYDAGSCLRIMKEALSAAGPCIQLLGWLKTMNGDIGSSQFGFFSCYFFHYGS